MICVLVVSIGYHSMMRKCQDIALTNQRKAEEYTGTGKKGLEDYVGTGMSSRSVASGGSSEYLDGNIG